MLLSVNWEVSKESEGFGAFSLESTFAFEFTLDRDCALEAVLEWEFVRARS
jgi:hypothetical protein